MEDYIKQMIKDGYNSEEDFEPIKCVNCESTELEDVNFIYEELGTHVLTEHDKKCKNCGEIVGRWAYGSWQV